MHRMRLLNVLAIALILAACDDGNGDGDGGATGDGGTDRMDGSTLPDGAPRPVDGATDAGFDDLDATIGTWDGNVVPGIVPCQGHIYQCGNSIDDDGDGLIDDQDPDCLGPCANNEAGFFLNIPGGDSAPCRLDCYFDQDQGPGNDGCQWDHRCDPLEPDTDPACAYRDPPPPSATCPAEQSTQCADFCSPLVPNGCDCFGCCELPAGSGEYVFIGSVDASGAPTCSLDTLEGCNSCTPVPACLNTCGRCELCLGRSADDLPADCFPPTTPDGGTLPDGGPVPVPDGGTPIDVCGDPERQDCGVPGLPACPEGFFCLTGCCTFFG